MTTAGAERKCHVLQDDSTHHTPSPFTHLFWKQNIMFDSLDVGPAPRPMLRDSQGNTDT
jgi:hypothetical protein